MNDAAGYGLALPLPVALALIARRRPALWIALPLFVALAATLAYPLLSGHPLWDADLLTPGHALGWVFLYALACGVGLAARQLLRTRRMTAGQVICVWTVPLCAFFGIGFVIYQKVLQPFRMTNQTYQETASPDGRYMATLAYRDGLTFGYEYLSLQPRQGWRPLRPDDHIPDDEVAEMGAEGIESVAWLNNTTLVVKYDASVPPDCFVLRSQSWHDVHLLWRGITSR